MTTEQGGAPSASAGGAPAPNPAVVDNVLASALMDQYGFVPLSVRYAAAKVARAVVEQSMAEPRRPILRPNCRCQITPAPDPRDAEIERLRDQLGEVCTALHNQLSDYDECGVFTRDHALYLVRQLGGRVRLRDMTIKAMQEMTRPSSLPDQRGIEIEQLRKRLAYDLGLPSDEVVNVSLVELLQRLKTMYMTALDEARSRNGDMRAEVEELETQRDDLNAEVLRWTEIAGGHAEEIERLRGQVDELAGIRVALFGEVRQALIERDEARTEIRDLRSRLNRVLEAVAGDKPPAAPRRWVAGDPEPEIGTTVTWGVAGAAWSRHEDRNWRSDACDCDSCLDAVGLPWCALLDAAATSGGLVEVVSTDG